MKYSKSLMKTFSNERQIKAEFGKQNRKKNKKKIMKM